MAMIDITRVIEVLAVITFFILLAASLFMLTEFYICDNQKCKAFNDAGSVAEPGTKEYVVDLLDNTFADGLWPLPYIVAAILTPLSLWFMGIPITIKTFAILFFISFASMFFILGFLVHHYVNPITDYVESYVSASCPDGVITTGNNLSNNLGNKVLYNEDDEYGVCANTESKQTAFTPFAGDFHVTFSSSWV